MREMYSVKNNPRWWTALGLGLAVTLATFGGACSSDRIDQTDGSVFLTVTDFDGLASRVGVNAAGGLLTIDEIQISNFPKNSSTATSPLQDVEMQSYEVRFRRVDTGSRTPTDLVRSILGSAPVNGNVLYQNLPLMDASQLANPPLTDLLFENGAFDKETGSQVITLDLTVTFFGRTIGGDQVASGPVSFTIEFVP